MKIRALIDWAEEILLPSEIDDFMFWIGIHATGHYLCEKVTEEEFKKVFQSYEQYKKGLEK
jgi:hypothetical protein